MADKTPSESVPVAQRYTSAWAEINTRLIARQHIQIAFLATTFVIFTAAIGLENRAAWFLTLQPIVGFACAVWVWHNNLIVGLLSAYCRSCEELSPPGMSADRADPRWHCSSQGWMTKALAFRVWNDLAFGILLVASGVFILVYVFVNTGASVTTGVLASLACAGDLGVAIWLVWKNREDRRSLLQDWAFKKKNGEWCFQKK